MTRLLWLGAGWVAVALGAIGVIVPGLPTTVFMIIAASCFARSSPRFLQWVLDLPGVGPAVADFRDGHGMPMRAKAFAIASIVIAVTVSIVVFLNPWWLRALVAAVGLIGIAYIALRVPTDRRLDHS